jgi:hypothetical protein
MSRDNPEHPVTAASVERAVVDKLTLHNSETLCCRDEVPLTNPDVSNSCFVNSFFLVTFVKINIMHQHENNHIISHTIH